MRRIFQMHKRTNRYELVCQGELIVDYFKVEANEDKEAYNLMDLQTYGGKVPENHYSKQDLVDKLNWYDRQVNSEYYNNPEMILTFEDQIFPELNSRITHAAKDLELYSSENVNVAYCDMDYNTGKIDRYDIECKIHHTDETGFCQPSSTEVMKTCDEYTLTYLKIPYFKASLR
jgi:hypothetical protein